jgi:hypothetical protein
MNTHRCIDFIFTTLGNERERERVEREGIKVECEGTPRSPSKVRIDLFTISDNRARA